MHISVRLMQKQPLRIRTQPHKYNQVHGYDINIRQIVTKGTATKNENWDSGQSRPLIFSFLGYFPL